LSCFAADDGNTDKRRTTEEAMPGTVRPVRDEHDGLLASLDQQRYVLRLTAYGLNDDQPG
jgi:hypothetical protein